MTPRTHRFLVTLLLAIFASVGALANLPHRHATHRDCALCGLPTPERRRVAESNAGQAQTGDGRPALVAPLSATVRNHAARPRFEFPDFLSAKPSVAWPPASSVLAEVENGQPPCRAPPHI